MVRANKQKNALLLPFSDEVVKNAQRFLNRKKTGQKRRRVNWLGPKRSADVALLLPFQKLKGQCQLSDRCFMEIANSGQTQLKRSADCFDNVS